MALKSILLLFLLSLLICSSQKPQNYQEDIRLYHQLINDASNHIVCFEYGKAMDRYKEAFRHKKEPFAVDIYNKMHVAIFVEDYDVMMACAKSLVSDKGLSLAAFDEATGYRAFKNMEPYWSEFKKWYPEGREAFLASSNQEDIRFFRQILEDDQKYRRHPERYTTFRAKNDSMDQVNAKLIRDYIQTNGYPTENRIGIYETSNRDGAVGKRVFRDFLNIVFRHYFGNFEKFDFDLTDVLLKEVKMGNLHPELFKQYMMQIRKFKPEYENLIPGRTLEAAVLHVIHDVPYIATINEELRRMSDSLRADMYLSDTKTLFSKAAFSTTQTELPFTLFYVNNASILDISDSLQTELFIETLMLKALNNGKEYYDCE